jgi:hypothetical protein
MNKKKMYIVGGIVIGAVIITASVFYFFPEINPWREDVTENIDSPPKAIHNAINILSMEEFISFPNKTGEGTQSNPYVIANFEITSHNNGRAIYIENCSNAYIVLENITIRDLLRDLEVEGVYLKNCRNFVLRNIEITNLASTITATCGILLSNVSDSTIINCKIHDVNVKNDFKAIYTTGDTERVTIVSNQVSNVSSTNLQALGVNCYGYPFKTEIHILNNQFENFYCKGSVHAVYLSHINNSFVERNFIRNLTSEDFIVGIRLFHSYSNKINDNDIRDVVSGTNAYGICLQTGNNNIFLRNKIYGNWFSGSQPRSPGFFVYQTCLDNIFALNLLMNNTYVREETNNNSWYSVEYFEPMGTYTMVGNYYSDHNIDTNLDFHYFVETPKVILNTNNLDYYPIHFFALDFDGDGLNNYQETVEYGTDIWENDTDKDGLSDYDEIFVYGTKALDPDTDGDGLLDGEDPDPLNPNNNYWEKIIADPIVVGLFLVGIGLVLNFFRHRLPKPKVRKIDEK